MPTRHPKELFPGNPIIFIIASREVLFSATVGSFGSLINDPKNEG